MLSFANPGQSPTPTPQMAPKQTAAPAPATASPAGVGSYTTGITAGALPQSQLDTASQTMTAAPKPMLGVLGSQMTAPQMGELNNQYGNLMAQQQQSGNVQMQRQAAPVQANLQLGQQAAQANAGLANQAYLARLQQDQFNAGAPARSLMYSMLGSGLSGNLGS